MLMNMEKLTSAPGNGFNLEGFDEFLRQARRRVDGALKRVRRPEAAVGVVKSPLGDLLVALTARGIVLNHYIVNRAELAATVEKARLQLDLVEDPRAVEQVGAEIRRYLGGDAGALRQDFDSTLVATPFQRRVLRKLQDVPRGALVSYQALGVLAGAPKGARAIGNAMHDNPVPVYIPCHRVIASDGGLGGYGGGAARKLKLLRSEGFALGDDAVRLPDSALWGHQGTGIYCRASCRTAARVDRGRIFFFAGAIDARRAGLRACKICRPE
jgi:methylated-DNA-[protein]-cysteine S-methyltransferase